MYTLYIPWVICDSEVNFGVMPVKGYARIEAGDAQNLFFRCQIFFSNRKKRPVFDKKVLVFQKKKKKKMDTKDPKVYKKNKKFI